jgi:NDP-sugar pyrophosphorylase family protein
MMKLSVSPVDTHGYGFIPPEFLPAGKDEYWLRNEQCGRDPASWRGITETERALLERNGNYCPRWDHFLVTDPFDPALIRNSAFYGLVRIGKMRPVLLNHHDFSVPAGIRSSTIISSDIGDDAAIQNCSYISHYIIRNGVILSSVDELQTTNHAKFGNGVIMEGEDEDVRIWIDVMNEAGGRSILPFRDLIPADAYLWAAYRDDRELCARLREITQGEYGGKRGGYGVIGDGAVIKSCRIIKDVEIGEAAYIKGANKLKNITVLSSEDEASQIGEGVELVNGIVGPGCHIFYGAKAVRFVMGRNCNLKYGARLIHSVLGDNSTISCCEVLNNLVFPVHEQHHNNSFLISSLIGGLSNMAAGATIGSNHNSRANDGELRAGRGFWPGLSVTLKHSSRFASFVLIAKGNYPWELDISLPFSLVNNNTALDRLEVMPAYFWLYNLYALERNSWKAENRDKRKIKVQRIESDYLAPDTAEEIIAAIGKIDLFLGDAGLSVQGSGISAASDAAPEESDPEYDYESRPDDEIAAPGLERHNRQAVLLKPRRARAAYREMLEYYAAKTIIAWFAARPALGLEEFLRDMETGKSPAERVRDWVNLGGQIVPAFRVDALRREIREGKRRTWTDIHAAYGEMAAAWPEDILRHAWAVLAWLADTGPAHPCAAQECATHPCATPAGLREKLLAALEIRRNMSEGVYRSRAKDFQDPFRRITYRNPEEMEAVAGKPEDNFFIKQDRERLAAFEETLTELLRRR